MPDDITLDKKIYCPDPHYLRLKTVSKQLTPVMTEYIYLPPETMKEHGNVMVAIDVMYVKNMTFLLITSRAISFITS